MKKAIIVALGLLAIAATGLQIREIVKAYQVAYTEERVPETEAVEANTKHEPLYQIGRVEGTNTKIEQLYAYDETENGEVKSVVIVDRKYGLTNKASADFFAIAPGKPATTGEKESLQPLVDELDKEQVKAEVISTHDATWTENGKERDLTLYKVFYKDVDQNEYLFFIEGEDGIKLDLFKKGYSRLSNY